MAAARQKILIVDDDSNIAELISLYLMKECYETKIVGDGEEALAAVDSFEPDLILLDLMLPGMDGYQVCREVRSGKDTPIIMLSAKGEIFDKVLGLEMGADDYMQKPFDSKELVARVKAVLRRYNKKPAAEAAGSGDKTVSYPRSDDQSHQLFRNIYGTADRYAAQGTGTSLLPRRESQPRLYKRAAPRPDLGIRVRGRHPHSGRSY